MKTLALTLALALAVIGTSQADEIINSEVTTNQAVTVKNRVEAVYVSTTQLTVHLEDVTLIGDDVVKTQRTDTITIGVDDTFVNPADGQEYNTFDYFIGMTGIDFDDVKAAIVEYKTLQASIVDNEPSEWLIPQGVVAINGSGYVLENNTNKDLYSHKDKWVIYDLTNDTLTGSITGTNLSNIVMARR